MPRRFSEARFGRCPLYPRNRTFIGPAQLSEALPRSSTFFHHVDSHDRLLIGHEEWLALTLRRSSLGLMGQLVAARNARASVYRQQGLRGMIHRGPHQRHETALFQWPLAGHHWCRTLRLCLPIGAMSHGFRPDCARSGFRMRGALPRESAGATIPRPNASSPKRSNGQKKWASLTRLSHQGSAIAARRVATVPQ
jgi:hypothetical protein